MKTGKITARKIRLDEALVAAGMAIDVSQARSKIMAGEILVDGQLIDKCGTRIKSDALLRDRSQPFVSRGGQKLFQFVKEAQLEALFKDAEVLDVGASTGGFTDCALQLGAARVTCLDVGKNLLDWSLRNHPRVKNEEGIHVRDFSPSGNRGYDVILADISFNSLQRLFPELDRLNIHRRAHLILLIKPQFELTREEIPEGGIVADPAAQQRALLRVQEHALGLGYSILQSRPSQVKGTKGNQEHFLLLK
jgi:23S rRNA (cytidine1920-2'-O)/16S rRNA (cytidine1409-2'-O)-methyltransferase